MVKKEEPFFLDSNISYKTGIKSSNYDEIIAEARKRAVLQYQLKVEAEKRAKFQNKMQDFKEHAIPFGLMHSNFKLAFLMTLICFISNIILGILFMNFSLNNLFNLLAAIIIFIAGKHLYLEEEEAEDYQISQVVKDNLCQSLNGILSCKLPSVLKEKHVTIIDAITIISSLCFILFPATNIVYSVSVILSLFAIFLALGTQDMEELNSHLQLSCKACMLGLLVKPIYTVIFIRNIIQVDYMNIALLFLFTCLRMWILEKD